MTESIEKVETESESKEEAKVGVFLCSCGKNIAGSIDVEAVAKEIEKLPNVKLVKMNTYTCSDPGQVEIETAIKEHGLERIVVSACSPRLHGPTWKK
ncbi:MAG: disulfide reductase, partial [Candidatus Heimdallarchaeota archaeon]|nr:disulfide reductase [Candidatus Heimdallarchaeota archaeon]